MDGDILFHLDVGNVVQGDWTRLVNNTTQRFTLMFVHQEREGGRGDAQIQ